MNSSRNRRLGKKILSLVKPSKMSLEEYKARCGLRGIDATITNGPYLHWILVGEGDPDLVEKVHARVLEGLEEKCLFDRTRSPRSSPSKA